ncbi:MAG: glutaminase A [bacterium]|nr:glutaminase A [bacterium]
MPANLKKSLSEIYERCQSLEGGAVADYIPELARVDPRLFAIAAVTTDGRLFELGDSDAAFTIQSTAKPFAYAAALREFGLESVLARVGVEPTGDDFNSISRLDRSKRPMNPMVNAGAISVCSMLHSAYGDTGEARLLEFFSDFAGEQLAVDSVTYASEMETTDGNRAIVYLLNKFRNLQAPPQAALDLYIKMCSIQTTVRGLATMGATLANQGMHPVRKRRVLEAAHVRDVLSVMLSCGMYNYAGQWVFDVGLPAKSGVSGAVLMIVPGVMAVCVYSPPLDGSGTSVRGIAACKELSQRHRLHLLDQTDLSIGEIND